MLASIRPPTLHNQTTMYVRGGRSAGVSVSAKVQCLEPVSCRTGQAEAVALSATFIPAFPPSRLLREHGS